MSDVGVEQIVKAPRALPLLGHALVMLRDPLRFLSSLPDSGEVVEIRLGPMAMLVVCDPELTRQVLLDDSTFDKGGPLIEKLRELMGDGLGTCPHAQHRRQRRMVQPAFHPARLPGYARTMAEQISAVTGDWVDGQTISPLPQMMTLSSRVTVATLFGTALPAGTMREVVQDVVTVIDRIYLRMLMGPLKALPTPGNRRYHRASARLRRLIERLVAGADPGVRVYLDGMLHMIGGNTRWHFHTPRYNGADHVWNGITSGPVAWYPDRTVYGPNRSDDQQGPPRAAAVPDAELERLVS